MSTATRGTTNLLRQAALAVAGVTVLVILWWWLAILTGQAVRVPTPPAVWDAIWKNLLEMRSVAFVAFGSGGILQNLLYTAGNVFFGVFLGTVLGVVVGIVVGRIERVRFVLEPPLLFMGMIPVLVLLPFLSLWFGTSPIATNGLVIFYTFGTVAIGARQATSNVSGYFEQYAKTLGADQRTVLTRVIAPAIVPEVIGSIRVALAFGWGFQAVAEILGGQVGTGRLLRVLSQSSSTAEMLAVVIVVGVVAVIADWLVGQGGRAITRWQDYAQ
jgi:ABC-type nitrate/sulfonate/bicarbonate transport system permease component